MRLLPTFALLASALSFGLAIDLHGNIVSDGPSTDSKVLLDGGNAGRAFIRADGAFTIHDVQTGSYVLSVLDREYSFPTLSITVIPSVEDGTAASKVEVRPYTIGRVPGDPSTVPLLAHPIQIKPTLKLDFYETKQAFSIMGTIMANKMILFMVLGIGFAVGMPKLLEMVDPETLKEVRANQAEMHKNLGSMQNMDVTGSLSKLLAGGEEERPAAVGSSSQMANRGNSARKRR